VLSKKVHVLVFYPLLNWKMHGETMKFVISYFMAVRSEVLALLHMDRRTWRNDLRTFHKQRNELLVARLCPKAIRPTNQGRQHYRATFLALIYSASIFFLYEYLVCGIPARTLNLDNIRSFRLHFVLTLIANMMTMSL